MAYLPDIAAPIQPARDPDEASVFRPSVLIRDLVETVHYPAEGLKVLGAVTVVRGLGLGYARASHLDEQPHEQSWSQNAFMVSRLQQAPWSPPN